VAAGFGRSATDVLEPYRGEDPGSEAARTTERVERATGFDPEAGVVAVIDLGGANIRSQAAATKVNRVADAIFRDRSIGWVVTYYTRGERAMLSRDGRSTYVVGFFESLSQRSQQDGAERLVDSLAGEPGVKLTGWGPVSVAVQDEAARDLVRAELIAFPILLLLSFWFFRGLVTALLPVLLGGLAIVLTLLVLRIAAEAVSISVFALNLVTALGLGLAIDYSLLMVSRFREELAGGLAEQAALRRTIATAGRTVLFSSLTVTAAMSSLLIFPQSFLYSMGIGGMAVGLIAGACALVVLPAALAVLGRRVNALSPARLQRAASREARPAASGPWYRLSRAIMRRPLPIAVVSALLMIALGLPSLGIQFTAPYTDVLPKDAPARQARETLTADFPPNPTQPLYVVAAAPRQHAASYAARLRELPGARVVEEPLQVADGVSVITAVSKRPPFADESLDLVRDIRAVGAPFEVLVGGQTAEFVDSQDTILSRLPIALAVLVLATLVPLFLMTGSLVVPIKALVMNLLTLAAMLGALVAIFQEGRLEGLLDYTSRGALGSSQALVLIALGFALSTDYGIFLLARIKEARDSGVPDRQAVAVGLERTGRILTAAALLFCVAMGAIATSSIVFVKEAGAGAVLAVLLDATIVRALLVPSLMELFGHLNWWSPPPLQRLHRRLRLGV
jgi:uncharacterized membrane protein YdfJ with MMPL/SSD domain